MKSIILFFYLVIVFQTGLNAQERPFLRVESKQNIFTQKVEVLDGPKPLRKEEVFNLLSDDPEALSIYEKAQRKQNINVMLSVIDLGLFVGSTYLVFAPAQQSSTVSNLFWPFMIGTVAVGIASGVFRREVRNLTREAVDLYNFGMPTGPPVYYKENRIDQPIFSFKISLR